MCRLLSIVSSEPANYRVVLHDAPRSLAALSKKHPDGWGLAVHADATGWALERSTLSACDDARFREVAEGRGQTLIAHVRQKTVGPTSLHNTHPFLRDGFIFAHNGTVSRLDVIEAGISAKRKSELQGDTDSERLFALILSRLDAAEIRACCLTEGADDVIRSLAAELRAVTGIGSFNFLLSNGRTTYAHRFGRTLFVLTRGRGDPMLATRTARETGATVETGWTPRRKAIFVASEALTDEPWRPVLDGTLIRMDRDSLPHPVILEGDYQSEIAAS
jgi:predicted glutamine amidotransferase